jgi:hypothetical protein
MDVGECERSKEQRMKLILQFDLNMDLITEIEIEVYIAQSRLDLASD